jgi:hypothetical protein
VSVNSRLHCQNPGPHRLLARNHDTGRLGSLTFLSIYKLLIYNITMNERGLEHLPRDGEPSAAKEFGKNVLKSIGFFIARFGLALAGRDKTSEKSHDSNLIPANESPEDFVDVIPITRKRQSDRQEFIDQLHKGAQRGRDDLEGFTDEDG